MTPSNRQFLDDVNLADVTSVFKKESTLLKNYRLVRVVSVVSKILERLI